MDILAEFYLDELHDMILYKKLSALVKDEEAKQKLTELSLTEKGHAEFFKKVMERLSIRVPKNRSEFLISVEAFLFFLFGLTLTLKIFEEREAATVVNYLKLYTDKRLTDQEREELKRVIDDEMNHESFFKEKSESFFLKNISDILLGVNDGLIELLAAVSGFAGAYEIGFLVGLAGLVIGVSGSLSMGVGAYLSSKSESELRENMTLREKLMELVFGKKPEIPLKEESASESGLTVAVSYFIGAMIPTLPYFLSLSIRVDQILSYLLTVLALAFIAYLTSATTGVSYKRKMVEMIGLALGASVATFSLGVLIHQIIGIRAI